MYQYNFQNNQLFEEEQQMTILNPTTSKSHQLKSMLIKWKCFGVIGVVVTILILLVFCSISPNPLTNPKTSKIKNLSKSTTRSSTTPQSQTEQQCETDCTKEEFFPICGSDRKTYNNNCLFKVATCLNPKVKLLWNGNCSSSGEILIGPPESHTSSTTKTIPTTHSDEDYINGK